MDSAVSIKTIATNQKRKELFERLKLFCERNNFEFRISQDEPYWKIDNLFETKIEIFPVPVWNYGKWSAAYKFLFEQDFTIEWEQNEDVSLCYYPAFDDFDSYFVIFYIPSNNFLPKPSKSIRH